MEKLVVIIPNYNHAKYLLDRITSVLRQGDFVQKIIILDDASTDESKELISHFRDDRIQLVCNSINSGSVFSQWQKGLSFIEKDSLVWIAESDDVADDDFLKEILNSFVDPDLVLAYSRSTDIDENGIRLGLSYNNLKWVNSSFVKYGQREVIDHLYMQCTIPNVSAVVFRNKFVDDSFFDHKFKLCGDWYFYIRLLQHGKIAYLSKPLNYHRFHSQTVRNKSSKSIEILKERLLIVEETCALYNLRKFYYISSMIFQIDLYIQGLKITDLKWSLFSKMVNVIKYHGIIFCGISIFLLGKSFMNRIYQKVISFNRFNYR